MPCRVLGAPVPGRGCSRGAAAQVHPGPLAGRAGAVRPSADIRAPRVPRRSPGRRLPECAPRPDRPTPRGPRALPGTTSPCGLRRPPWGRVLPAGRQTALVPGVHTARGVVPGPAPLPSSPPGPRSDAASVGCGWHPGFLGALGSRDAEETHALAAVCWGRRKQNTIDRWLLSAWNPFSLSGGWTSKVTARVEPVSRESRAGRVRVPAGQPLTRLSVARAEGARRVSSIGALTPFTGAPSP